MNKIPPKLREEMSEDPFYSQCCITGLYNGEVKPGRKEKYRVEWHHNLIFAGKQVQEKECILPIVKEVHALADTAQVREILDHVMLHRWSDEQFDRLSKAKDWRQRLKYLNEKLGTSPRVFYCLEDIKSGKIIE